MATAATYQPSRRYIPQPLIFAVFAFIMVFIGIILGISTYWWIGLSFFVLFVAGVPLHGLADIPANPPHRGVPTFLGQRYPGVLSEGWHIRLGYSWLYGFVLVNVERKNLDFKPENVRTPDTAELAVPISITYIPTANNLLAFLNSGGETGVANILQDIAGEAIREWASAVQRGPQTWREAYGAHAEALQVVMNALTGRDVQALLDPDEVARMRGGNGETESPALGITLNRVNITQIQVLGKLAEAAEQQAIEEAQRAGETIERDFLRESIDLLVASGLTPEEARRAFQVERKKITETVTTNVVGVTPETFKAAGDALAKALGRGGEGS